jgi:hypothetical protein
MTTGKHLFCSVLELNARRCRRLSRHVVEHCRESQIAGRLMPA